MPRKATKTEMIERIATVKDMLLKGYTRSHIQHYGANSWNLTERPIDEIIKRANDQIAEISHDTTAQTLNKIVSEQMDMYRECRSKGEIKTARQILMDIAKLKGLEIQRIVYEERELASEPEENLDHLEDLIGEPSYHN